MKGVEKNTQRGERGGEGVVGEDWLSSPLFLLFGRLCVCGQIGIMGMGEGEESKRRGEKSTVELR